MKQPLNPRHAVYVGSFDPLTLGHEDIIRRGAVIFERLTVGIGINPDKKPLLPTEQRVQIAQEVLRPLPNVDVACFEGLAVEFVKDSGAAVMLRGVRSLTDMEGEFTMSLANRALAPELETVFLMASEKYTHLSSSLIRQIAQMGRDHDRCAEQLRGFVPAAVIEPLLARVRGGES